MKQLRSRSQSEFKIQNWREKYFLLLIINYLLIIKMEELSNQKSKQLYQKISNKNYSKKVELTPRDCTRFNDANNNITVSNAMIYLKLREEQCKRKDALRFAGKNYCRIDSTTPVFGPPDKRILKISSSQSKITHNVVLKS